MPDGAPPTSYEYGHKITRDERSEETFRIGGLMDMIDATKILADLFAEVLATANADQCEGLARTALARLTKAPDHPILACRVYEMATDAQLIAAAGLLFPLNAYTTSVLEAVADVTAPDGWQLSVAADSDVVLTRADGEWVALSMRGTVTRRWVWSRGSLGYPTRHNDLWESLADALAELTAPEEAPDAR